jgi:hypothetical protein
MKRPARQRMRDGKEIVMPEEIEKDTRPEMTAEMWDTLDAYSMIQKGDVKDIAIVSLPNVNHTRWTSRTRDHYLVAPNGTGRFGYGARDYKMMRALTAKPMTHKEAYAILAALQRWAGIPQLTQAELRKGTTP